MSIRQFWELHLRNDTAQASPRPSGYEDMVTPQLGTPNLPERPCLVAAQAETASSSHHCHSPMQQAHSTDDYLAG